MLKIRIILTGRIKIIRKLSNGRIVPTFFVHMGWKTVTIGCECKASLNLERLRVTIENESINIPLNDINTVIFTHDRAIITVPLLSALIEHNISVVICNSKNDPIGIFQAFNGHSLVFKQLNKQLNWKITRKKRLWKTIVEEKISSEIAVLQFTKKEIASIEILKGYRLSVLSNDDTNREAISAKMYFSSLFGSDFTRDDDNFINAALNYGYKIIASNISRILASRGLLTQVGMHHIGESNPFNLTYDFIEPFRFIVDLYVALSIEDEFTVKQKRELIDLLQAKICIDNKWIRLTDALEDVVDSYIAFLNDTKEDVIKVNYSMGVKYSGEE